MAANRTTVTPSSKKSTQYALLSVFAILVILMYCLIFFTGNGKATPKLGIDLQGGTRVTLTPSGNPSDDQLKQAQTILMNRVNGMGVSGSEVQIDGQNLVITVPGTNAEDARNLGTTAKLVVRPVMEALGPDATQVDEQPKAKARQNETSVEVRAREVEALREFRQAPLKGENGKPLAADQQLRILRENATKMSCQAADRFAGNDDPARPLITCDSQGQKYILGPAPLINPDNPNGPRLDGSFIKADTVEGGFNNQQGHTYVSFAFKGKGVDTWARVTTTYNEQQVAMVLDSSVVSAPTIQEPIKNGNTQITGPFNTAEAISLANNLKYGALPLNFSSPDGTPGGKVDTIPATLGIASLNAGLIAGLVGLILVAIFALVVYRALGIVTMLSLVATGAMVYGSLVLLGRWIGYTLDLSGVAGLIIGIGTTADSFVVFFERIKDEIREGRSFRSAVPRGWAKARRTIVTGNAVTFIAAIVLYTLAVGEVRGFAFTTGLTTVFDLLIVFIVTSPLVLLASHLKLMSKPAFNGLGKLQEITAERRAAAARLVQQRNAIPAAQATAGEEN